MDTYIKHTNEEVIEALIQAKGNLKKTAELLGLRSANALRVRVKKTPELNKVREQQLEERKDFAESKLDEAIEKGESWAITLFLKCQARDRGYGDNLNLNVSGSIENVDLTKVFTVEELREMNDRIRTSNQSDDDSESIGES